MNNVIESLISIDTDKMFVILLAIFFTIEQLLETIEVGGFVDMYEMNYALYEDYKLKAEQIVKV